MGNLAQGTESSLVYPIDIKVDPERLLADLNAMEQHLWMPQNRYANITNWDGIALYSASGDPQDLRCCDNPPVYITPAGQKCSYICNELLPQFRASWLRVVFYRLKAGTRIGEHHDYGENRFVSRSVRIHIPIVTNKDVIMYVEGCSYHFPLGTAWYFDASALHAVENNGSEDRIHLVADIKVSEGLETLLKPLTFRDRARYVYTLGAFWMCTVRMFCQFVRTEQGRIRIRARIARILGSDKKPFQSD